MKRVVFVLPVLYNLLLVLFCVNNLSGNIYTRMGKLGSWMVLMECGAFLKMGGRIWMLQNFLCSWAPLSSFSSFRAWAINSLLKLVPHVRIGILKTCDFTARVWAGGAAFTTMLPCTCPDEVLTEEVLGSGGVLAERS